MTFKLVGTSILVVSINEEESEDGIVFAKNPDDLIRGTVREVGNGVISSNVFVEMLVGIDSIVLFDPRDARKVPMNNEEWYVVKQEDILLIEEEEE